MNKKVHLLKGNKYLPQMVKRTVGLIGTHPGVGVTHTGIMYANYLSGVFGYKTALLEVNTHNDLQQIEKGFENGYNNDRYFIRNKITFFKTVKQHELTEIYNRNYECFICDYGYDWRRGKEEFLRCDTKIVLGSLTEWKQRKLWEFIENGKRITGSNQWYYFIIFGQSKELLQVRKKWKENFFPVDYNPNPFQLSDRIVKQFGAIY